MIAVGKWYLCALGLIVCTLLGACSSTDSADLEPAELVDFNPTGKIEILWSRGVGVGQDKRYTLLVPALSGDRIYASDIEGNVVALDRHSGEKQWEVELDEPVSGGVGVGAGLVLMGTYAGEVIALDLDDGSERWRARVSSEVLSAPQANRRIVVVQCLDGKLFGFNAADGSRRWVYDNILPALTLRGTGSPVVTDTTVYAGIDTGKLLALDVRDGLLKWEQRVSIPQGRTELERVIDVDGSPLLAGDLVYAANYQGRIAAFSRANGRGIWNKDISSYQNLAVGFNKVYASSAMDSVIAFRSSTGVIEWENNQLVRRNITAPQTFDNYVAVSDFEGYVHILSQSDGKFVARRKIDSDGIRSPMVSEGEVLYILSNDGKLVALKIKPIGG